jgi:hypothetical protein
VALGFGDLVQKGQYFFHGFDKVDGFETIYGFLSTTTSSMPLNRHPNSWKDSWRPAVSGWPGFHRRLSITL